MYFCMVFYFTRTSIIINKTKNSPIDNNEKMNNVIRKRKAAKWNIACLFSCFMYFKQYQKLMSSTIYASQPKYSQQISSFLFLHLCVLPIICILSFFFLILLWFGLYQETNTERKKKRKNSYKKKMVIIIQ